LVLIISLAFAIRTSTFQTWLANQVASYLADEWGTTVTIDQVEIIFFDSVEIKGLYAEDQHGDTLIYSEKIWVEIDDFSINKKFFYIEDIQFENTHAYLVKHKGEDELNLNFIIEYFKPAVPDTSKSEFDFQIQNISLENVHFVYRDENKPETEFGVNYRDIDVRNINLILSDFKLIEDGVAVNIIDLQANEKSGVNIQSFQSDVIVNSQGVKLALVHLETNNSELNLDKLDFNTKNWKSWQYFEDSVKLVSKIEPSTIDLNDISYFAPALKGLDQVLSIKGNVRGNIRKLKVKKFDLKTGKKTHIAGSFIIPDYRDFYNSFIDLDFSNIQTCVEDIESFPMYPFDSGEKIKIPSNLRNLGTININDGFVYGPISGDGFILKASVTSGLGNVIAQRGIKINYSFIDSTFYYQGPQDPEKYAKRNYDVLLDKVDLKAITGNDVFGLMNGGLFFKGKGLNKKDMDIDLSGHIHSLQFKGYTYQDFDIEGGKIAKNQFNGQVTISEENVELVYNGRVDFGKTKGMDFKLDINRAMLTRLNIIPKTKNRMETELCARVHVKTTGNNFNNLKGKIDISHFNFRQDTLDVFIDSMSILIARSDSTDTLKINSDILDARLSGKFDLNTIQNSLRNQFLKIFPEYFADNKEFHESNSKFDYDITLKNVQPVVNLFSNNIELADNTHLYGNFSAQENILKLNLKCKRFAYKDKVFDGILIENKAAPLELDMNLKIDHISVSKNLKFNHIDFNAKGKNNFINSELNWQVDKYPDARGSLIWETQIISPENYILDFDYSQIPIRGHTWIVEDRGMVLINQDDYELSDITISKGDHLIFLNGILSKDSTQTMDYTIQNFELKDLDEFLDNDLHFDGNMNAKGSIRDIFTNMDFNAVASVDSFQINDELVGDLAFNQNWNNSDRSFDIDGGITRKFEQLAEEIKTFDFKGKYYLFKENQNLDLDLIFDKTDISFVNSFLPKTQISNVRGFLNGQLEMTGTLSEPVFLGKIDFQAGNAYIDMLGNNFGIMGEIESEDYGFIINHMYITDPEGNTGLVTGSIFHENFKNWNYEAIFNLFDNPFEYYTSGPDIGFPKPLERFQILNTEYEDGDTYYGKAYVTGYASIFGYDQHFEVNADIKTLGGTKINFPMYGSTQVKEDNFIIFKSKDTTAVAEKSESKISGVEMNLKFNISPETEANIVFDESTGDLIHAKGSGNLNLNMNRVGELSMTGKYTINEGNYYLSMKNLIKKNFKLKKGGTIDWTGSPYNADIDVQAIYSVKASFSEAIPDITNADNSTSKDRVDCILALTKSLINPQMDIDIQTPSNNESAKATLSRIKSSEDELNRQFFSLLMLQKFQPIVGVQTSGNAGVANVFGEALTGQLNSILNSIDENYNFNVNYNQDDVNKTQTYEVGMSTEVLNDRLIISGSFGLENYSGGTNNQNNFIGDVKIEYKISKDGSFRVSAFNESNDTRVLQDKDLGQFTQGIGIHYEEDFDKVRNFKLLGYIIDVFRKDSNRVFWHKTDKSHSPKWRSVYDDMDNDELKDTSHSDTTIISDSTKVDNGIQFKNDDIYDSKKIIPYGDKDPFKQEDFFEYHTIIKRQNED
jgi:hypothetical protein